jgi:hypothetical protein
MEIPVNYVVMDVANVKMTIFAWNVGMAILKTVIPVNHALMVVTNVKMLQVA